MWKFTILAAVTLVLIAFTVAGCESTYSTAPYPPPGAYVYSDPYYYTYYDPYYPYYYGGWWGTSIEFEGHEGHGHHEGGGHHGGGGGHHH